MVGTEARRVETEEANDARLESLRPREMPERFLSRRPISTSMQRSKQQHKYGHRKEGIGMGRAATQHRCPTEHYKSQIRAKTHWASEFFLDEEADWRRMLSSPIEPRDRICLP